jgi:hypothetical protein
MHGLGDSSPRVIFGHDQLLDQVPALSQGAGGPTVDPPDLFAGPRLAGAVATS